MQSRILILGGGITGLAAATFLKQNAPDVAVHLWEARERLGGVLYTEKTVDGFLVEQSADNFLCTEPWVLELAELVGIKDQIIPTRSYDRRASVLCRGKIVNVPDGFTLMSPSAAWPMLATPLLSWSAKLRLAREWFVAPRPTEQADESLASFARRRFGNEVFERLIQPLIGGIYTADPEKLSLAATLPRFLEMERKHGSLLKATLKGFKVQQNNGAGNDTTLSGARYNKFMAPRLGMSQLVEAIEKYLADDSALATQIHLNTRAVRVEIDSQTESSQTESWKVWRGGSSEPGSV